MSKSTRKKLYNYTPALRDAIVLNCTTYLRGDPQLTPEQAIYRWVTQHSARRAAWAILTEATKDHLIALVASQQAQKEQHHEPM